MSKKKRQKNCSSRRVEYVYYCTWTRQWVTVTMRLKVGLCMGMDTVIYGIMTECTRRIKYD